MCMFTWIKVFSQANNYGPRIHSMHFLYTIGYFWFSASIFNIYQSISVYTKSSLTFEKKRFQTIIFMFSVLIFFGLSLHCFTSIIKVLKYWTSDDRKFLCVVTSTCLRKKSHFYTWNWDLCIFFWEKFLRGWRINDREFNFTAFISIILWWYKSVYSDVLLYIILIFVYSSYM